MKEKKQILNQINSFKNRIIKGSKEKNSTKKIDNNTIQYQLDNNLIYINNGNTKSETRNTTAPSTCNKKHKKNKHLKITAKNREEINLYSPNIRLDKQNDYVQKLLSQKILTRSIPKNIKQNANKKLNKNKNIKRINSSNNIKIVENNAIDFFTKKILEGTKTNMNSKNKNSRIIQFKENNIINNQQMGLFSINLHSNNVDFDDININLKKIKLNKSKENRIKSNKSLHNTADSMVGNAPNNKNIEKNLNSITSNNINSLYKNKRSTSIDMEANKLIQNNNKERKKNNGTSDENKLKKVAKTSSMYHRGLEDEKNKLEKNNKNKITKNKNEQTTNITNIYQYLILKGNASYLVKYCMYHRINWVEVPNTEQENSNIFNFKWKELSYGIDYYNLNKNPKMKQIVNHFEYHHVITNKANMFINLMKYCEKRDIPIFKFVPFTIVFKIKDRRKIKNKEKQKRWNEKLEKLKTFIQGIDKNVKNYNEIGKYYNDEEYIKDREKRDEFERMKLIKDLGKKQSKEEEKDNKNKEKKIEEEKYKGQFEVYSDIFPRLKITDKLLKKKNSNEEKEKKFTRIIGSNTLIEIPNTHFKGKNMWVIKAINLNRGMCIKVVNSFEQMEKVINKFKTGVDYSNFTIEKIEEEEEKNEQKEVGENDQKNILIEDTVNNQNINQSEQPKEKTGNINIEDNNKKNNGNDIKNEEKENDKEEKLYNCTKILIQKYIENPLLYKGRKCDMRIWVLLTHQMKVFLFKEGHLKTCSVEYDLNSKDAFTHITNYSFQKHNTNFQKFEKGNEVPFYEFQKFIDEKYPEKNYKLNKDLMKQIKEIITHTMRCGKKKINRNNRNFQFEIFGYDFMLDSDFNAFLIEINTNPGLEISSPWIQIVVPRMLDDALRLTVDKVFEPVFDFTKNYKGDYTEEQKKVLIDSKIEYDFNAVKPNNVKDSPSISSSILSKISTPSIKYDSNILNINLELDEFDKNLIKEKMNIIEKKEEINDNNTNNNKVKNTDKSEENKNSKYNEEKTDPKTGSKKKLKYISPFPVPGYSLDENLWDFICDLNDKEPLEKEKENEIKEQNSFTGIKHLLKKRKNKSRTKTVQNK